MTTLVIAPLPGLGGLPPIRHVDAGRDPTTEDPRVRRTACGIRYATGEDAPPALRAAALNCGACRKPY